MIHEFEYKIEWLDDDGFPCARDIYVTQVDDTGLEDYEVEEVARDNAYLFAEEEEPSFDYEVTLIDAR